MARCLSSEQLNRYAAGQCSVEEQTEIKTHLAQCEKCRQITDSASGEVSDASPTRSISGITDNISGTDVAGKNAIVGFENYQIVQELPQGGQAIVYKAVHKPTKTNVAIKILLPTLMASTRARFYFEREAELIARLDHPNIVRIRDSGIIHGQYFFVMEFIKGQPLYRYVETQNLPFRQCLILFKKICEAVTYAHQQGIIHRDLKSGNVLIDERGEPHILDFGLAKAIGLGELDHKDSMPTLTGQWAGSLSNMSPEQAAAKPESIDVRTDVYALGMMLYHILTGRDAYDTSGPVLDALKNIQSVEPTRPRKIISKFDPDIEAILLTTLAKDKALRYQSVAGLQNDIENWLTDRPISVRSISALYLMRKLIARHRYVTGVLGLLMLIILSSSFASFNLYLDAKAAQRNAERNSKQWSQTAGEIVKIATPMHFANILELLRKGGIARADRDGRFLAVGSKERIAAEFLVSQQPLKEKEAEFRRRIGDKQAWFADFIVGEHYLKDGDKNQALNNYRNSFQSLQKMQAENQPVEIWLVNLVGARLYELTTSQNQAENVSAGQKKD